MPQGEKCYVDIASTLSKLEVTALHPIALHPFGIENSNIRPWENVESVTLITWTPLTRPVMLEPAAMTVRTFVANGLTFGDAEASAVQVAWQL